MTEKNKFFSYILTLLPPPNLLPQPWIMWASEHVLPDFHIQVLLCSVLTSDTAISIRPFQSCTSSINLFLSVDSKKCVCVSLGSHQLLLCIRTGLYNLHVLSVSHLSCCNKQPQSLSYVEQHLFVTHVPCRVLVDADRDTSLWGEAALHMSSQSRSQADGVASIQDLPQS